MKIRLCILDIPICLDIDRLDFAQTIQRKYHDFLDMESREQPVATITLMEEDLQDGDAIAVHHREEYIQIEGGEFKGLIDKKDWMTQVRLRYEPSVVDCFLRVFYSVLLPRFNGFLVHAAGLACGEDGYVFLGVSESGKTTTARNAKDYDVLNDELTGIRQIQNCFYLYGTPFRGEFEGRLSPRRVVLKKVFFLDQKTTNAYIIDDNVQMIQEFMDHIFFFDRAVLSNQINLKLTLALTQAFEGIHINILAQKPLERWITHVEDFLCAQS